MPTDPDVQGHTSEDSATRSGGVDANATHLVAADIVGRDKITKTKKVKYDSTVLSIVALAIVVAFLAFLLVLIYSSSREADRRATSVSEATQDQLTAIALSRSTTAFILPTLTSSHTPTLTVTETPTPIASNTSEPNATDTPPPSATDTPLPPTSTATNTALPTVTSIPPTATRPSVNASSFTNTPVSPLPPTAIPTSTDTPAPTFTYTPSSTNTPTATTPPPCPLLEIFPEAWSCEAYFRFPDPPGTTLQNAFVGFEHCVNTGAYGLQLTYSNTGQTSSGWGVQWTGSTAGHLDAAGFSQFRFWVRGQVGGETFQIGLKDTSGTEVKLESVNLIVVSAESWKQVSVALSRFTGVNLSSIDNVNFGFNATHGSGTICIDEMQFAP